MTRGGTARRGGWRRVARWLLVVLVVELVVIWLVARALGPWLTFAILVAESLLGAWLVRREGAREWRSLSTAISQGRLPAGGASDAVLVMVGGLLLLLPGFLTDLLGFACVLPVTRPLVRAGLVLVLARRGPQLRPGATPPTPSDTVIRGQVVDHPADETPQDDPADGSAPGQ